MPSAGLLFVFRRSDLDAELMEHGVQEARERAATLLPAARARAPEDPELQAVAFEQLQNALEELRVVEEELREQNDELAAAREAVEAERQRYQELFEFAPDGYLVTDARGIIREANRAVAALLNVPQRFLAGKPLWTFVNDKGR